MNTMVMNSGNSKTSEPQRIILKILDKTNLKRSANSFALSNLRIQYTWKNIKRLYRKVEAKNKNTLVSGNAGDEKNLYPGSCKFIYF